MERTETHPLMRRKWWKMQKGKELAEARWQNYHVEKIAVSRYTFACYVQRCIIYCDGLSEELCGLYVFLAVFALCFSYPQLHLLISPEPDSRRA